ncbi:sensor histidine kinase [Variovorax sp. LjRoot290]|uniref:sensor histidine kinase n=1 Tax=Variovorax sp. LjRoot290 TaxID=3342316 RepID=UPI003F51655A
MRQIIAHASISRTASSTSTERSAADERWTYVQRHLIQRYIDPAQRRKPVATFLAFAVVCICWTVAPVAQLICWFTAVLCFNTLGLAAEAAYRRQYRDSDLRAQTKYMRHLAILYVILGAIWGSSVLLFFDQGPAAGQFGCWIIVGAMLYVPLNRLSLVPMLLRSYTNTFLLAVLVCSVYSAWQLPEPQQHFDGWILAFVLFQAWLINRMSSDTQKSAEDQLGLQYDLEAQRREALEAVKTKDRFLAAATHDMRQPVIALSLYAEYLEAYPESHLELAPKITGASNAVNSLFNSLFDLSKFDAGEIHLAVEPVRIAQVFVGLQASFEPLARAKGLELRVRVADAVIQTDSARLKRMIGNVISNAIKYSRPGRKVLLAARIHGPRLRVEVWDQGIGIPAGQIDEVFAEFYRVEAAAKLAPDGMGIGLSLVARLAKALNTRLAIASIEGRGTRVTMEIGDIDPDPEKRKLALECG